MNKFLLLFITAFISIQSPLEAAVYKGQEIFLKKCIGCHKPMQAFVAGKDIKEWEELMKDKGKPLSDLHLINDKSKKSWKYFKTKKYLKKSKHLKQFLVEYAKDSGRVLVSE